MWESVWFSDAGVWVYGWPATYLEREVESTSRRRTALDARIDDSLTWRMWERASGFFVGSLLLDVFVGAGACLFFGWSFELWRRRRAHLLQVYLSAVGVL